MSNGLSEQEIIRRQKMEDLRSKGIDPFGTAYQQTHHSKDIIDKFDAFKIGRAHV